MAGKKEVRNQTTKISCEQVIAENKKSNKKGMRLKFLFSSKQAQVFITKFQSLNIVIQVHYATNVNPSKVRTPLKYLTPLKFKIGTKPKIKTCVISVKALSLYHYWLPLR